MVFYLAWKIIKSFSRKLRSGSPMNGETKSSSRPKNDFSNIQDAEFEDITKKSSPESTTSNQDR